MTKSEKNSLYEKIMGELEEQVAKLTEAYGEPYDEDKRSAEYVQKLLNRQQISRKMAGAFMSFIKSASDVQKAAIHEFLDLAVGVAK